MTTDGQRPGAGMKRVGGFLFALRQARGELVRRLAAPSVGTPADGAANHGQGIDHEPLRTARTKNAEALSTPATSPVKKKTPHAEGNGRLPTMEVADQ